MLLVLLSAAAPVPAGLAAPVPAGLAAPVPGGLAVPLPAGLTVSLPAGLPVPVPAALAAAGLAGHPGAGSSSSSEGLRFSAVAADVGLDFVHENGGSGERYMHETIGSGTAVNDLDVDGHLDVYLVQSAATPGYSPERPLHNRLYRSRGDGTFGAAPRAAGADDDGYGMGAAVADYDADGFPDVFVTNFGANRLFRNNGDGSFTDVTAAAGVGDERWGASAAWADVDGDGHLDLYVTNYVDFAYDNHKFCGNPRRNLRAYCHPDVYNAQPDRLYRSRGDGTFEDVSEAAGVADTVDGKGLGVVFGDFDDDGDADIYVANDSTRNFLYVNRGDGTFLDDSLLAGVGYSEDGKAEAGMGTDWGDFDGDGRLDVVVTNLDLETNTLYRNIGDAAFSDVSFAVGLGEPSLLFVGFGTNWVDLDGDADLDLFVANGHIIDNITEFKDNVTYAQPNHLFRNDGGRLVEVHEAAGPGFSLVKVSRGSAVGDVDDDGDPDIVVTNNDQPVDLLRNDSAGTNNWLQLRLVGTRANRTAAGARLRITPSGVGAPVRGGDEPEPAPGDPETAGETPPRTLVREVRAGSSYLSTSDPAEIVGLGSAGGAEITIRWPGGGIESIGVLRAGSRYVVMEGRGVVATRPFSR